MTQAEIKEMSEVKQFMEDGKIKDAFQIVLELNLQKSQKKFLSQFLS
ncbi:MAG: hypothetical protein ACFFCL_09755 [Promethearchaeota archaeon]